MRKEFANVYRFPSRCAAVVVPLIQMRVPNAIRRAAIAAVFGVLQIPLDPSSRTPFVPKNERSAPVGELCHAGNELRAPFVVAFNDSESARKKKRFALITDGGVLFLTNVNDLDRPANGREFLPGTEAGLTQAEARTLLRIAAAGEKGNQDRLLPMAPEFAEMLLAVPQDERTGRVFKGIGGAHQGHGHQDDSEIGREAGVKVKTIDQPEPAKGDVKPRKGVRGRSKSGTKFASAHDLRRSFCERWAARVMPPVLMQLARHETVETTMKFYVGRNAEATADQLWEAVQPFNPLLTRA